MEAATVIASAIGYERDSVMTSMVLWMLGIGASVALLVLSAAARQPHLHMVVAAGVALLFALAAIAENRRLRAATGSEALVASSTARYMGLVLIWGSLGLFVTYGFSVLKWKEWWHFFLALIAAAGLCLFFAATLKKDAEAGKDDPTMKTLGRYLAMIMTGGMFVTMIGLLADGKMTRYMDPRHTDWAAQNIFFFGAVALAAIGVNALVASRKASA
jgi:cytosine/uracil/thiamine/allantoin permease